MICRSAPHIVLAASAVFALAACSRSGLERGDTPGADTALARDAARDVPAEGDADVAADTSDDTVAPDADTAPDADPPCPVVLGDDGTVAANSRYDLVQPLVGNGVVYAHGGDEVTPRAFGLEVDTEAVVPFDDAAASWLIDARDDTLLWLDDAQSGAIPLDLRATVDGTDVGARSAPTQLPDNLWWTWPRRMADRRVAALVSAETRTLEIVSPGAVPGPMLDASPVHIAVGDELVVWSESPRDTPELAINAWDISAATQGQLAAPDVLVHGPVATTGRMAYWLRDGAVVALDVDTGDQTVVDPGPCGAPWAADGLAAVACGFSDTGGWLWEHAGTYVLLVRGAEVIARHDLPEGRHATSPRVSRDLVAWLQYGEMFEPGEVVVWDAAHDDAPEAVGPVGVGCYTCGRYWPPVVLALGDDLIAWSYGEGVGMDMGDEAPWRHIRWRRYERRCF